MVVDLAVEPGIRRLDLLYVEWQVNGDSSSQFKSFAVPAKA